jgi:chromosome segregation and condensation protein ScpB
MVAKTKPLTIASLCKLNDLSIGQPEKVLANLQEKDHVAGIKMKSMRLNTP